MAASTSARPRRPAWVRRLPLLVVASLAVTMLAATPTAAQTSFFRFAERPPAPPKPKRPQAPAGQAQMLVQANEIHYDYSNERVSAVGNVQIYYNNSTVEADRVVYDQRTKRLHAQGNVRLTEPDGKITYGDILDLNDDYRDGFVDSLRLDAPDNTRFAATRAERSQGNYTVFRSGVYTACEPCKDDPKKPPLWQVKAARIIHNENEKMIYFEQAQIEFFGYPLAYFPYFSAPDPTVKRKTGFLMPIISSKSAYGVGIEIPYYMALAPDYDFTFSPLITTRQGPLLQGEFRQRTANGSYSIRVAGINQLDKDRFLRSDGQPPTPGYRDWRGGVESAGQFALNDKWVWGWNAVLLSDRTFFQDYPSATRNRDIDPFKTGRTEGVSQLYLSGRGDRSYYDVRAIYYLGFSELDRQKEIPVIHPVMDYSYVVGPPVLGGELSYKFNLTSLSRDTASFDAIKTGYAMLCGPDTADPAQRIPKNCLLRGIPGAYTRFSAQADWRRSIIDPFGQVFTPFVSLRADAAAMNINNTPGVSNYIQTGESDLVRAMPTVGFEYRYPFVNVQPWGTQTLEPIAQVIVRPNETGIGKLPNEDSQSLIFDDGNLFKVDKFSGWDRVEGGGRVNAGVLYTTQFNQGGFANVLVGQSYHLFGANSFAMGDISNTGLNSGLDKARSDYVARVSYQPDRIYTLTTRYRFDEQTFNIRRFEIEGRANYDRWSVMAMYGNYDAQPELGFLKRREGILTGASVKLTPSWVVEGAVRYDLDADRFDQTRIGVGYVDDCFILAANYITSYSYSGQAQTDHRLMLQLSLRTLGGTSFSQSVGGLPGGL
jgi:LPS-assembly protein